MKRLGVGSARVRSASELRPTKPQSKSPQLTNPIAKIAKERTEKLFMAQLLQSAKSPNLLIQVRAREHDANRSHLISEGSEGIRASDRAGSVEAPDRQRGIT